MGIGTALDMLLKAKKKKPGTLATETGINKNTIYGILKRDNKKVDLSILERISDNLGVPIDYFFDADKVTGEDETSCIFSYPDILPIGKQRLPVLGSVSCGEPQYAEEELEFYIQNTTHINADFILRARGDSMIGARIYDGDLIFVRKQPDVDDGQIAVVIIDDETLLKRVYKLRDGRRELRAENPKYRPIMVGGRDETRTVQILGRAVALQTDVI